MMDTQDTAVIQPGATVTPLGKLGTTTVSTSTSATRPQSSIIQAPAIEPDDEVPATERTSTFGTGSESYHKCDICSKAFLLDFSGIAVDYPDGQHSGIQATAEPNLWTTLASSFGQDADRFVRYCSSRTFGKIWLCEVFYLCTFLDITLIDLDEWSRKGCLLSRDLFEQAKDCFKPHEQSGIESWVLGIQANFLFSPTLSFQFLQLKPRAKLEFENGLDRPTFWRTRRTLGHSYYDVTTATTKGWSFKVDNNFWRTGSLTIPSRLETNPLSTLPKVRGWLEKCLDSHSHCPKPGGHVPTRLMSLSTSTEGPASRLYLQLASESNDRVPYAALSYCWGGNQVLKLEKSSFDRFRTTGIGIEELPPTIADAVKVTLSLGIRHLWVDALCILQDSDEDKAREIALMGEIYSAATVTLAISGASSVDDGFLCHRSLVKLGIISFEIPIYTTPRPIRTSANLEADGEWENEKHRSEANSEPCKTAVILHKTSFVGETSARAREASPLYKRAWTFQERLLSPRLLDFGVLQTRWWCMESTRSEMPPKSQVDGWLYQSEGLDGIAGSMRCWEFYNHHPSVSTTSNPPTKTEGLWQITNRDGIEQQTMKKWWEMVWQYTQRHLTYREDRLPALSTIAQCFQARTGYQYAAGLWMEEMPAALLWQIRILRRNTSRDSNDTDGQDVYYAPTWSWASVDDEVFLPPMLSGKVRFYGKALDLCIEPKPGGNVFGGLRFAALVISGVLKPAFWRLDHVCSASSTSATSKPSGPSAPLSAPFVKQPKGDLFTTHIKGTEERLKRAYVYFDAWRPEFEAPASIGSVGVRQPQSFQLDVYLLVIAKNTYKLDTDAGTLRHVYTGLVLQRTLCGEHIRLGKFDFEYNTHWLNDDEFAACVTIAQWLTSGDEEIIRLV